MNRRLACVGDMLENGGEVLPYSGGVCHFGNSNQAALIGGQAYCDACKSVGTIAKAGGPRRLCFMGEVALDGDVVLCKCSTPMRIVALLAGEKWYEDGAGSGSAASLYGVGAIAGRDSAVIDGEIIEQFFEFKDGETGAPIEGYCYDLFSNGTRVAWKSSLREGRTISVMENSHMSMITWLDKSEEDRP